MQLLTKSLNLMLHGTSAISRAPLTMLLAIWFVLLLSVHLVLGQFPAVCNTPDSLNAKECCPSDCSGHGNCIDITDKVVTSWGAADREVVEVLRNGPTNTNERWPLDVRYQWPLRVFERVCNCNTGWGGYDCNWCDFGYVQSGTRCVKTTENQLLVRRNFSALSLSERREYIDVIRAAKHETEMKWAVVVSEPTDSSGSFELQNVSTYDMLVTMHALSTREQENDKCKEVLKKDGVEKIDFAHENSAFLTWHRYYLLLVESELRRIAEEMNIMDFTLPYWDWQVDIDKRVFSDNLFGTPFYSDETIDVSGTLFDDWPTVCDQHYRLDPNTPCSAVRGLCNVNEDRARPRESNRLQRGKLMHLNDKPFLPDEDSIIMALAANDSNDNDGFRKRLEGFVDLCPGQQCIIRNPQEGDTPHNNLHNAVHIFLGGHMRIVPSASNDPIFFLHHANIDRYFEIWMRRFEVEDIPPYSQESTTLRHPGHNLNDYLVPFFPLKTNADMYKRSSQLGFTYDRLQAQQNFTEDYSTCSEDINSGKCKRGGYNPDSSNSIYQVQLYLLLLGVAIATILM